MLADSDTRVRIYRCNNGEQNDNERLCQYLESYNYRQKLPICVKENLFS